MSCTAIIQNPVKLTLVMQTQSHWVIFVWVCVNHMYSPLRWQMRSDPGKIPINSDVYNATISFSSAKRDLSGKSSFQSLKEVSVLFDTKVTADFQNIFALALVAKVFTKRLHISVHEKSGKATEAKGPRQIAFKQICLSNGKLQPILPHA